MLCSHSGIGSTLVVGVLDKGIVVGLYRAAIGIHAADDDGAAQAKVRQALDVGAAGAAGAAAPGAGAAEEVRRERDDVRVGVCSAELHRHGG